MSEDNRILNLRNTDAFKLLIEEKKQLESMKPHPDEEGAYVIENGIHVKGPTFDDWKSRYDNWVISYKTWFDKIDQDYKLCFKACYEKTMNLDFSDGMEYVSSNFQFHGFIMYTNIDGTTRI